MYECVILNAVKDLVANTRILRKLRILVEALVAGKDTAVETAINLYANEIVTKGLQK